MILRLLIARLRDRAVIRRLNRKIERALREAAR